VNLVVFWTDALIFLVVTVVLAFVLYAARHEHLRAPWRQVARRPVAMAAAVVLVVYVIVGLTDSVRFRTGSGEVVTALDMIMAPVRENVEKTYSAPFAAHSYVKEMQAGADANRARVHPRLAHGGAHLADPQSERLPDIATRAGQGALVAALLWGAGLVIVVGILARQDGTSWRQATGSLLAGRRAYPWRTILATVGLVILVVALLAFLAPWYHVFGTDKVGQDVLYQSVKSVRTGLVIGTLTTLVLLPLAILLGIMGGYFRGLTDDVIQYVYTTLNSIPGVLLIAAAVLMLQVYMDTHEALFDSIEARQDLRLLALCVILGVTSWTGLARLLRAESLKLREQEYVEAAVAFGVGHGRIILRHILPNVMHIVLISVVLDFSALVLAEAVLSYVGVGVDPTMSSWGNMINAARLEMARDPLVWWSLLAAFTFMFTLVLAANLFSDAVRDAFDPRLRQA
jgi:peptide/nickel transport system permease protein